MATTTQYLNSDWIIYLGSDSYYYGRSGSSGKVLVNGLVYNTVKNTITGGFTGTLFDDTLNRYEGYTSGILQSFIDFDAATYSGSTITSTNLNAINVNATRITGSNISGSTIIADTLTTTSFNPANIVCTTLTGSSIISGSTILARTISGSTIVGGLISGSIISAQYIPLKGYTNTASPYTGSALNLKAGTNVTLIGDNDSGYVGYTITSNTGSGEIPASYIIWKSGTTYYSQDGHTGTIASSANATTVIQNALDAIRTTGGTVFLKSGTYPIGGLQFSGSSTASGSAIIGEDRISTILFLSGSSLGAQSYNNPYDDQRAVIIVDSNVNHCPTIKNLRIEGNRWNQKWNISGIWVKSSGTYRIEDCIIQYTSKYGICISGASASTYPTGMITRNKIYYVNFSGSLGSDGNSAPSGCTGANIAIYNKSTDCEVNDNMIGWIGRLYQPTYPGGTARHTGIGIQAGTSNTVHKNWVWSTYTGIHVTGDDASITDNFVEANGPLGIVINGGEYDKVTGNRCRMGATDDNIMSEAGIKLMGFTHHTEVIGNTIWTRDQPYGLYYGIEESGSSADYNFITNNIIGSRSGSLTGDYAACLVDYVKIVGTHTKSFKNVGGGALSGSSGIYGPNYDDFAVGAAEVVIWSGSDGYIYAIDRNGNYRYRSQDICAITNKAISGSSQLLTTDRTTKEKVLVIGNYTITGSISIPSYTIFELRGQLTLLSGSAGPIADATKNADILHCYHRYTAGGGDRDIEIVGGIYDGNTYEGNNRLSDSSGGVWNYNGLNCIYFTTARNIIIRDLTAKNAGTVCLHTDSCIDVQMKNVRVESPYYHGWHGGLDAGNNINAWYRIEDSYWEGPSSRPSASVGREDDGEALSGGFDSGSNIIRNIHVKTAWGAGISTSLATGSCVTGADHYASLLVDNCQVTNTSLCTKTAGNGAIDSAITVGGATTTGSIIISNNTIYGSNYGNGITTSAPRVVITGNTITTSGSAASTTSGSLIRGIYSTSTSGTIITNNNIYSGLTGYGTGIQASDYSLINGNRIRGWAYGIYVDPGTNDAIIENNYITGSGTAAYYATTGVNYLKNNFIGGIVVTGSTIVRDNIGYDTNQFPVANFSGIGVILSGIAGETMSGSDCVYMSGSGKYMKSCATGSKMPIVAICASYPTVAADGTGNFLFHGSYRKDSWSWTTGSILYGSTVSGSLTGSAPTGSANQVQPVAVALTGTVIIFNPSYGMVEVT